MRIATTFSKITGILFLALFLIPYSSVESGTLSAKEIVGRSIKEMGTMETWNRLVSMTMQMKLTSYQDNFWGIKGSSKVFDLAYRVGVETRRFRIDYQNTEDPQRFTISHNGFSTWLARNDRIIEDKRSVALADRHIKRFRFLFTLPFNLLDKGVKLELVGSGKTQGLDVFKVKATFDKTLPEFAGDEYVLYIDKKHFLIRSLEISYEKGKERYREDWSLYLPVKFGTLLKEEKRVRYDSRGNKLYTAYFHYSPSGLEGRPVPLEVFDKPTGKEPIGPGRVGIQ